MIIPSGNSYYRRKSSARLPRSHLKDYQQKLTYWYGNSKVNYVSDPNLLLKGILKVLVELEIMCSEFHLCRPVLWLVYISGKWLFFSMIHLHYVIACSFGYECTTIGNNHACTLAIGESCKGRKSDCGNNVCEEDSNTCRKIILIIQSIKN